MKFTMRDKVCQLIGKYEAKRENFNAADKALNKLVKTFGVKTPSDITESGLKAMMCSLFLDDLKQLLEEDDKKEEPTHE